MTDAFNNVLIIGDDVAFVYGSATNTLQRGIVTGDSICGKTRLLEIVLDSPDGSTTLKIHPSQVCKLVVPA